MDMKRKLEIVDTAVKSISEHADHDSVVLLAALEKARGIVEREISAVVSRQQVAADAALKG